MTDLLETITRTLKNGDSVLKRIYFNGRLYTCEEFVCLDEAIEINQNFGTNPPYFDDGKINHKHWSLTAIKTERNIFLVYFDPKSEVQFAPAIRGNENESLSELFAKTRFDRLNSVPYTELVQVLGSVIGGIVKYLEDKPGKEVFFTPLDSKLYDLYKTLLSSTSIQRQLKYEKIRIREESGKFSVSKIFT